MPSCACLSLSLFVFNNYELDLVLLDWSPFLWLGSNSFFVVVCFCMQFYISFLPVEAWFLTKGKLKLDRAFLLILFHNIFIEKLNRCFFDASL